MLTVVVPAAAIWWDSDWAPLTADVLAGRSSAERNQLAVAIVLLLATGLLLAIPAQFFVLGEFRRTVRWVVEMEHRREVAVSSMSSVIISIILPY